MMPGNAKILILCNPLLDITAEVDADFLERHHVDCDTEYIYSSRFSDVFEELEASGKSRPTPGGAGLGVARVVQWILRKNTPPASETDVAAGATAYIGCVGDDAHGKELLAQAEADGVRMLVEVTREAPTGVCAVCKMEASRSLIANLGAAKKLSLAHMSTPGVQAAVKSATIVYTTAYAAPFHVKAILELAAATRAAGEHHAENMDERPMFAFGLSSCSIMDAFGEDLVDLLTRMDCIFGNQSEIRDLALILQWVPEEGMTDAQLVAKLAREMIYDGHTVRRVIMTRGALPVVYATSTGECGEVPTSVVSLGTVKHLTTGAGDALVGGFLAAAVAGHRRDTRRCVEAGVKAAGYALEQTIQVLPRDDAPRV